MSALENHRGKTRQSSGMHRSASAGLSVFGLLVFAAFPAHSQESGDGSWSAYGGDSGGTRYSSLRQINRENVSKLQVAWTYRTGALAHDPDLDKKAAFEATPILVDGKLFLSTPHDHVIALNPETGAKLWEF